MSFNRSIGMILLAIYLILVGLAEFGVGLDGTIMNILALAAGVLILIGR